MEWYRPRIDADWRKDSPRPALMASEQHEYLDQATIPICRALSARSRRGAARRNPGGTSRRLVTIRKRSQVLDFTGVTPRFRIVTYAWPAKQGPRPLTFPHVLAAVEAGLERLAVHVGKSREK